MIEDLEKLAREHKPCPDGANPADLCYYWTIRNIYDAVRAKKLTVDEAKKAKAQAIRQHGEFSDAYNKYFDTVREWNDNIRKTDGLRADLSKSESVSDALMIAAEIIKAMTGDVTVVSEVRRIVER